MKKFWASKTFWLNVIAGVSAFTAAQFGFAIDGPTTAGILAVLNVILRFVTKTEISL